LSKKPGLPRKGGGCLFELKGERGSVSAVFDCKVCGGPADLSSEICWGGILSSLRGMGDLDAIILSGFNETEYSGSGLEALSKYRRLARSAERLAGKEPPSQDKRCLSCAVNPRAVFSGCAAGLAHGPRSGHAALVAAGGKLLAAERSPACKACVEASCEDLAYLWKEFESLSTEVVREAFGIVGDGR
jgi:hypothetical protein